MKKLWLLLLLGGAVGLTPHPAWALPWEGWVTVLHSFSKEMTLGRQLFFNYQSINAQNPSPGDPGDPLWVRTDGGVLIGKVTEINGTYPDWKTAEFDIPSSLVFSTQKLWFSTEDLGERTLPGWVFNGISSPIPEPATLLLLGSGLLGLAGFRKRKA